MSTIGFIINGQRRGCLIAPEWWPDAGMTMYIFVSFMNRSDIQQMGRQLQQVQWAPDDGTNALRRPLDTMRGLLTGSVKILPEYPWREWRGEPRWAYFVDFDNCEYEIWRYGRTELCSGRASFDDLTWDAWCAMRQRLLDAEGNHVEEIDTSLSNAMAQMAM